MLRKKVLKTGEMLNIFKMFNCLGGIDPPTKKEKCLKLGEIFKTVKILEVAKEKRAHKQGSCLKR